MNVTQQGDQVIDNQNNSKPIQIKCVSALNVETIRKCF
uniref:Uncharacterized protein n=1 Tax=Arundo donax TaxID=35708 RepID=A0A0A9HGC6_ARUDO